MRELLVSGIYAITDCERLSWPELLGKSARILEAGVAVLQYRNKHADGERRLAEAQELRDLCARHSTPFIVNDDVDLAKRVDADGVHLGADDESCANARRQLGHNRLIGVSCYDDPESALSARASGADYVAFGAFFPTSTKQPRTRADVETLKKARGLLDIPIVAIGGITPDNAGPLLAAGADLLAVVSSLYREADPSAAVRRFNALFAGASAA